MYSIEIQNNWWTMEKINYKAWADCLNRNLSEAEIKQIVENQQIWPLQKAIGSSCRDKNGNIDQGSLKRYISATAEVYTDSKNSAKSKTDKVMWLSNIWIYNDWIEENAPFDLMKDFEKIDNILFWDDVWGKFEPEENVDLSGKIQDLLNKLTQNSSNNSTDNQNFWNNNSTFQNWNWNSIQKNPHGNICDLSWKCENYTELQRLICENNWNCNWENKKWFTSINNDSVCKTDESWLSNSIWTNISKSITSAQNKKVNSNNSNSWNSSSSWWNSSWNNNSASNWSSWAWSLWSFQSQVPNPQSNYKKVDDNPVFPCSDFLCIDVNFIMYEDSRVWWYDWPYPSIGFLINRSNDHFKKFMNSSLSQSKMSINNFELSLKDLKLSDMFHLGFQISYEPVPNLFLTNSDKDFVDKWEINLDAQLDKFYKAHSLDYKQQNDLSAFKKLELNNQLWLEISWNVINGITEKVDQLSEINQEMLGIVDSTRKTIEEKVRYERKKDIEIQMKEVENYNKAINTYVTNLEAILKELLKIPIDDRMT